MKIRDILKTTAAVAGTLNPAVGAVIGLVNQFLPTDQQLPPTATGSEVQQTIDTLPPEQRHSLLEREIDLKIAQEEGWTARFQAMAAADGQSTRPKIALMMAKVLSFEILAFTTWCFVYPNNLGDPVLWAAFATLTGTPALIITNYFGNLRKEQNARTTAVSGVPSLGPLSNLVQAFKR